MPQKKKVVNVGGTFKVDLGCSTQRRKAAAAVVELYEIMNLFLPGNEDEKFIMISSMLQKAKLSKGTTLRFSFPRDIRVKYGFEKVYCLALQMGAPTRFYTKELLPHLNVRKCEFRMRGLGEEEKNDMLSFFGQMSRTCRCANVLNISVTKWKDAFGVGITLSGGEKIKIQGCSSLDETKILIEKNITP